MAASHHCHCGFESRVVDVFDPIRTNKGTRPGFVWQTLLRSADDPMMNFREGLTRGLAQLRAFHGMRVETGARSGTAGCQTRYGRTTSPPVLRLQAPKRLLGLWGLKRDCLRTHSRVMASSYPLDPVKRLQLSAFVGRALLASLVLSKLVFGAGAWPPLGVVEARTFGNTVTSIYRATLNLRRDSDQHVSLAAICALIEHNPVADRTYSLLATVGGPRARCPLALIRADGPCLGVLRDALVWLHDRVKATFALPHPLEQCAVCVLTGAACFEGWLSAPSRCLAGSAQGTRLSEVSATVSLCMSTLSRDSTSRLV